jgi:hypothetical protein
MQGCTVAWLDVLQAVRSRDQFPAWSLELSTHLILLEALWPYGRLSL